MPDSTLRLTEIFLSLQGESSFVGLPTIFIRLTGCPLRCTYCDTAYAFEGGTLFSLTEILQEIGRYACKRVCVTGGEPLAQPSCYKLLDMLIDEGYAVSLETSGAMPVEKVNPSVIKILDLKTPSSEELSRNLWENMSYLNPEDQVKFVIGDEVDFSWAISKVMEYNLIEKVSEVLFSPVHGEYELDDFAERVLDTGLPIRMQMQVHKYIWNDTQGR